MIGQLDSKPRNARASSFFFFNSIYILQREKERDRDRERQRDGLECTSRRDGPVVVCTCQAAVWAIAEPVLRLDRVGCGFFCMDDVRIVHTRRTHARVRDARLRCG